MNGQAAPPAMPRATYRLQFNQSFTFDDAAALVPYMAELGISHVYASPFLMARAGSLHGYDITDHNRFNPEIGDAQSFDRLVAQLHQHGMGIILDFVPNHMGVGGSDNPWWLDLLEWGQASPFADFFDIDWSPAEPTLTGKVLLPFLGDHYGNVLERGELKLHFDEARGVFSVRYWDHIFPVAVRDYPTLLRAVRERLEKPSGTLSALITEFGSIKPARRSVRQQAVTHRRVDELKTRLAAMVRERPEWRAAFDGMLGLYNGQPGERSSFQLLHRLLERQAYRVAYWRVATAEINYRRFFDINDLAGLKMERDDLFEVSHQLLFRLIGEGKVQGVRLDHIDGLYDPGAYCRRLQDRAAFLQMQREGGAALPVPGGVVTLKERGHLFYLVVEKIMARHEHLRERWPIDGTTGYEFMNLVNGLFVDPEGERALTVTYNRFIGRRPDFEEMVVEAKRQMVETNLASEFNVLANDLHEIARQSWSTRDFTLPGIQEALLAIVSNFPVYRTYVSERGISDGDRRNLDWALSRARRGGFRGSVDPELLDFVYQVLSTDLTRIRGIGYRKRDILRTAMKFQQFTGPVMAKSVEDTAFYRYFRLISLNEVGGEPTRFGVSPSAFHYLNQERQKRYPLTMLATATHDHKRGEDTRVRISAISELGLEWRQRVSRWSQLNKLRRGDDDDPNTLSRNDEYLFYQAMLGSWPLGEADDPSATLSTFADRMVAYMIKAVREAKVHTFWSQQNPAYEQGLEEFVRSVLDPKRSAVFLADFARFEARIAPIGALNGLAQCLLKLSVPGVPDTYQGAEFWDLSLVDPDNRRPVDFDCRRRALAEMGTVLDPARLDGLLDTWRDGRVKQYVIARILALRNRWPNLFTEGDYIPLEVTGDQSDRVVAFMRRGVDCLLVVVVPRLVAPLLEERDRPHPPAEIWGDTAILLPEPAGTETVEDIFTGRSWPSTGPIALADLLSHFPLAALAATWPRPTAD
ncbi:MAG: malto-oligosyltrehalose synthase [Rhodospirillaceae bacterium]|nr:malto-oligosyltrehalose synthase [Rhodospirillaceae bacterium]